MATQYAICVSFSFSTIDYFSVPFHFVSVMFFSFYFEFCQGERQDINFS